MLELKVVVDKECAECLVYQHQESALRGKLHVKTTDRLKLRQITIRLISTELVDINDSGAAAQTAEAIDGGGLHPFLQKSTKTVGTWVVLAKGSDAHVLAAGEHQYSFEIGLPRGLDGSVDTRAYRLGYELESRLEHSFKLKPDTALLTAVALVQVPMGLNLHSDDRVSMRMASLSSGAARRGSGGLALADVPLGRAVCVLPDAIDQGRAFVLRHVWDAALALRVRLPRGRVFPADAYALVDVEAVPMTNAFRCTAVSLALEELAIVARPQRSTASVSSVVRRQSVAAANAAAAAAAGSGAASNASSDSLAARQTAGHNALAYAQECSSPEYQNAITTTRVLSSASHTAWTPGGAESLASYSGVVATKLSLRVPPPSSGPTPTHTDIRNSHIQVHHQIVYELTYERVDPTETEGCPATRIQAVAHALGSLGNANIVRRDELGSDRGGGMVVRGTLPVAIVPKKISALWGLKNVAYDDDEEVVYRASVAMPMPPVPAATASSSSNVYLPPEPSTNTVAGGFYSSMPFLSGVSSVAGMPSMAGMPFMAGTPSMARMPSMPGVPSMPSIPGMPSMPSMPGMLSMPGFSSNSYPPPPSSSSPLGFNLGQMPQQQQQQQPFNNLMSAFDSSSGQLNMPYGGMAYNSMALQQQIIQFQEQQRQQQQQFFQQISEQYAHMMVTPPQVQMQPSAQPLPGAVVIQPPTVLSQQQQPDTTVGSEVPPLSPAPAQQDHLTSMSSSEPNDTTTAVAAIDVAAAAPAAAESSSTVASLETPATTTTPPTETTNTPTTEAPVAVVADLVAVATSTTTSSSSSNSVDAPAVANNSVGGTSAETPSQTGGRSGRQSPPPLYEDLLPPAYEVPTNQPPPYRPVESSRGRRYMWDN